MQGEDLLDSNSVAERSTSGEPTVAVAFGGGGARGFSHIHIIEVLDELGIRPVAIAGVSIGAIMGSAMAAGMRGSDIREYALSTMGKRREVVSRIWKARPAKVGSVFSRGFQLGQFNIERMLPALLPADFPTTFEQLEIPTQIIATDFYAQQEVTYSSGNLLQSIAASSAIPALFRPVLLDGRYMIDGGISNPVPIDHLEGLADVIIGVDVVAGPAGEATERPSTTDLMFGASQLMMQSIISMKLKNHRPDIFLRPEVRRFRVLDFFKADEVLASSQGIRDELKHAIDAIFAYRVNNQDG